MSHKYPRGVFQCCLFLGNQYNLLPNMEFLSFRAVCVTTAFLEKQIRTFSPIQILIFRRSYFGLGPPVLHEITVEDVRSDCFNYSPMKGSKVSWNGKSNECSVPDFFLSRFHRSWLRPAAGAKTPCAREKHLQPSIL